MKIFKVVLSLVIIVLLCYVGYKFVEFKQANNSNTSEQQKGGTIESETNIHNVSQNNEETVTSSNNNIANEQTPPHEQSEQPKEQPEQPHVDNTSEQPKENEVDPAFATSIENIAVLVNPSYSLAENYAPEDLVYPDVRFTFDDKIEKRMLREEAARALEKMFAAAEVDGIYLAGVSGYRSHDTQTKLFNYYVKRDGYDKAKTFSAEPGTSEHETGLAIDISGSTGKCAAQDCFADTAEAVWLENNSSKFGFIVRYPEGKEHITGYKYEPWHMRYVGVEVSEQIFNQNITLEEYYGK